MGSEREEAELSLLTAMPRIRSLVLSCAELRESGFTKSQFMVFALLSRGERLRMSRLASYLSSSKEQATRTVAQLVEEGYVEREQDPDNRTLVYVRLADKGRELMSRWRSGIAQRIDARVEERLSVSEREELSDAVRSLSALLDKLL